MVLNTSFNVKGQPIVNTPEEAVETFLGTGIEYLFVENYLVPAEFLALNRTAVDYPRSKTIAQLFAEQVEKSPDVVAVIAGSVQLTYRELSARSDEIASYLQKLE